MSVQEITNAIATLSRLVEYGTEIYTKKQLNVFKRKIIQLVNLLAV